MFLQWSLKPCLLLVPWCTSASEPYQLHFHKTTYLDDHGVAISQHSPTFFEGSIPPRSCMTFNGFWINIVWSWWAMDLPHSLYIPLYLYMKLPRSWKLPCPTPPSPSCPLSSPAAAKRQRAVEDFGRPSGPDSLQVLLSALCLAASSGCADVHPV